MKTALDWLIEQMPYEFRSNHTQELFKQAKEKEKEQIMKSYKDHHDLGHIYGLDTEEYYYDIYKSCIKKITITELNQNK